MPVIKILHLSDLHIGFENSKVDYTINENFHSILLDFLTERFHKGDVDYVVISGDLGDKCIKTIHKAGEWLTKLQKGLNIDKEKIIVCAGNHDIDTRKLPLEHDSKRLDFSEGRDYVLNQYNNEAFSLYNEVLDTSINYISKYIYNFPDVKFVVLNSSWLSQSNRTSFKATQSEIENSLSDSASSKQILKDIYSKFGIVLSTIKDFKDLYSLTTNYSENTRQQIVLYNKYKLELKNIAHTPEKPNLLIFHHPEDHLHEFEKYQISGMEGSGNFGDITIKSGADALICGHIHPRNKKMNEYVGGQIQMLIGAAAHIDPKQPFRPIFYVYNILNDDKGVSGNRETYYWNNKENKIEEPEIDDLVLSLNPKSESVAADISDRLILNIANENELKIIKAKIKEAIGNKILFDLKELFSNSMEVNKSTIYSWVNDDSSGFRFMHDIITFEINEEYKINLDIIYCDEGIDSIITRTRCINRLNNSLESKKDKYIPLYIDVLSCYITNDSIDVYKRNKTDQFNSLMKSIINDTKSEFSKTINYNIKRLLEDLNIDLLGPIGLGLKLNSFDGILFIAPSELSSLVAKSDNLIDLTKIFQRK